MTKKDEGKDNKDKRAAAVATLQQLEGLTVAEMNKKQQEQLITALAQLLNVADKNGVINV